MNKTFGSIPLTWTLIGDYSEGVGIYLCDQIVNIMPFNEDINSNNWLDSKVKRWLKTEFYSNAFSEEQRERIVDHSEAKAHVFLLSSEEYVKYNGNIPLLRSSWWLRSQGDYTNKAAVVNYNGDLNNYGYYVNNYYGVRPAILLRKEVKQ
jgi:hypothetical protein